MFSQKKEKKRRRRRSSKKKKRGKNDEKKDLESNNNGATLIWPQRQAVEEEGIPGSVPSVPKLQLHKKESYHRSHVVRGAATCQTEAKGTMTLLQQTSGRTGQGQHGLHAFDYRTLILGAENGGGRCYNLSYNFFFFEVTTAVQGYAFKFYVLWRMTKFLALLLCRNLIMCFCILKWW